ncbi:tRNA (N(6)-L-threonylcarbamoyladenosine(37)-C(2))-methylthiotransferase MtaB [Alicyclobacillus sp. TC]|uniref:Threonylcarbamoyladenosine tRNA methylthiotransferase MtaB n=2 Tax=Alicyclobacillus tolerans TaxID=90970 RepID=A0A1M6JXC5_9BACL|nr:MULTISPECIES: tRNA (N(6)-L-threonylcarbamoyladenosine(37)-C(2))-methylthiotransferase MtaB [Alicyclobacillus]MDP9727374.1 threonylcarbamoyladenosine tRNA methylthiotransferase MtaB [Alicyclobacillus tengchongensis]QRF23113.1 tRNA (N(6)-L-threonylcarbamoyladenosine(37)-C(2))-methylthiotransferase MtaB [Alicyclobacillus sp. TC]SHJ51356.1 threonylcarbamoyladenosine tRNA methylthiotransferase MtaB [Alicyclobacillus montanus]
MTTVAFHTLGCKVNFYDTEGIWHRFQQAGYQQVPFTEPADVYVINTCTVTHLGDRKSRQAIRRAVRTNPDALVVVTGCYAQMAAKEIAQIHGVDLVVGNDRKMSIVDLVEQVRAGDQPLIDVGNILKSKEFEEMDVPFFHDRTRANLKIQDGCNHFCTFCIIPHARGLIRSRQPESVLAQARKLARAGYREIVLTGIHTGGYGEDLDNYRLADLLRDLECEEDLYRLRISSIEASEIDDALIEVLQSSKKICNHLHIPLQSASDTVLKRMNRHYRMAEYLEKLGHLRTALPDLAVTTDIIVGFPGETDEEFQETVDFLTHQSFAQIHVFPYSQRKGTPAAKFAQQVNEDVKEERVQRLIQLSRELTQKYAQGLLGDSFEVIPEEPWLESGLNEKELTRKEDGPMLVGHAANYLRMAFTVPEGIRAESLIGEVCRVRLSEARSDIQMGQFEAQVTFAALDSDEEGSCSA